MKTDTILMPCPECQTDNPFLIHYEDCTGAIYNASTAPMHMLDEINKNGPVACQHCETEYAVKLTLEKIVTTAIALDDETGEPLRIDPTENEEADFLTCCADMFGTEG